MSSPIPARAFLGTGRRRCALGNTDPLDSVTAGSAAGHNWCVSVPVRVLFVAGAVVIVASLVMAFVLDGLEAASWVAGIVGAMSIATGFVARAFPSKGGEAAGDRVDQTRVRSGGSIVGKIAGKSEGPESADRVRQHRLDAQGDVIGKKAGPEL